MATAGQADRLSPRLPRRCPCGRSPVSCRPCSQARRTPTPTSRTRSLRVGNTASRMRGEGTPPVRAAAVRLARAAAAELTCATPPALDAPRAPRAAAPRHRHSARRPLTAGPRASVPRDGQFDPEPEQHHVRQARRAWQHLCGAGSASGALSPPWRAEGCRRALPPSPPPGCGCACGTCGRRAECVAAARV